MKKTNILRALSVTAALTLGATLSATETIVIKGSDTLGAKMVPQIAEAFKAKMAKQGVEVAFEIAAEGSSTGVASVIDGTAAIGMSSRERTYYAVLAHFWQFLVSSSNLGNF